MIPLQDATQPENLAAPTWGLVFATLGLIVATAGLVYFTWKLFIATTRLAESSERLEKQGAEHFRLAGPLLQVVYPSLGRWTLDEGSPGRPYRATIRFFVKNEGRQPSIVAGAVVKWKDSEWKNGMPLSEIKGLPFTVAPGDRSPVFEGDFVVWKEELELLTRAKKATIYAFTPTAAITEEVEFPIHSPEAIATSDSTDLA